MKRSSLDPPVVSLQVGIQGADHKFGAGSSNSEAIGAHSECGCYDFSVIGKITFGNKKGLSADIFLLREKQAIVPEGQSDLHVIDGTGTDKRYQCAILELEAWVRRIVRNDSNLTKAIKQGVSKKGRAGSKKSLEYVRKTIERGRCSRVPENSDCGERVVMVLIYEEHNAFRLWVAASGGHRHGSHHIPWCNTRQSRWGTKSQCVVRRTIV